MKITKYIYILIVFLAISSGSMQGQDFILSQPFANSLYLAPSFAGMTNGGRAFLTYRNQWTGFSGGYNTVLMGADLFFRRQNSSVGAFLAYDRQISGAFTTIELHPQYNYRVQVTDNLYFRPGVEFAVFYKTINPDKLIFANQITENGIIIDQQFPDMFEEGLSGMNIDVAASVLLYNENFWVGGAVHHITGTGISFVNSESRTPRKWSAFAGKRFVYNENRQTRYEDSFTLAGTFDYQSPYSQLQLGVVWHWMPLELGIWYRDLPFVAKGNLMNRDAIIGVAAFSFGNLKISYSYDVTISDLAGYTAGAHEIVLTVKFNQKDEHDISFFCY